MPHSRKGSRGPRRGRGRGRGRGFRGAFRGGIDGSAGSRAGEGELVFEGNFEDFNSNNVFLLHCSRGTSPARGRGGYQPPPRMFQSRRGRVKSPRGRGIGFPADSNIPIGPKRSYVSISTLERECPLLRQGSRKSIVSIPTLEDRPLLRPVKFVRGQNQRTLFEEVEEILHAPGEAGGSTIENLTPSAGVVERLFQVNDTANKDIIDSNSKSGPTSGDDTYSKPDAAGTAAIRGTTATPNFASGSIVQDPEPQESTVDASVVGPAPIGGIVWEEEAIVYDAPHPKIGRSTHAVPSSSLASPQPPTICGGSLISNSEPFSSESRIPVSVQNSLPVSKPSPARSEWKRSAQATCGLRRSPLSRKMAKKERAATRRRAERKAKLDSTGLGRGAHGLKALYRDALAKVDVRKSERRRGDSDVDWGTEEDGEIEDVRSVFSGMELDTEVPDTTQFAQFARGVPGLGAGEMLTIADLEDIKQMKNEDEEETDDDDKSDQDDGVLDAKERKQNGEGSDPFSSESSGEGTAKRMLATRSEGLRANKNIVDMGESSPEEENTHFNEPSGSESSWEGNDDRALQDLEELLDENYGVLHGGDRKARKKLLKAAQNGEFLYDNYNMRKKDRDVPFHLREQWDRDRANKAARKRLRELARFEKTAEYAMRKSFRKKKTEKVFGSARFEDDTFIVSHTADMATLEQQIRAFLGDIDLNVMVLPPKNKEWRRKAHLLAEAFNLKSKSRGKGEGRYTTLIKTTRSGTNLNERRISRLASNSSGPGFQTPRSLRNRDGDEVGKFAPKLSETNIGFRLLQQMGWEEGDRIGGATGGLVDPLTVIIKTTKLGLGASR